MSSQQAENRIGFAQGIGTMQDLIQHFSLTARRCLSYRNTSYYLKFTCAKMGRVSTLPKLPRADGARFAWQIGCD